MKLIKLLYSVIVSGITAFTDWVSSPLWSSGDMYRRLLYPERPAGLQEESYECAKLWEIFWNSSRLVTTKKTRWIPDVKVHYGKMEDIKPTEAKREEYYEEELITFKTNGILHIDKLKWRLDSDDFDLYCYFDSTKRKIEKRGKVHFMKANRWRDLLKERWDNKVQEQRENKRIREENEKIWHAHFCRQEERRRNEPRGLFWPF